VSHELKTPLTCLHGYMQLLAQRFMDLDPRQASVEDLTRDVHMARMAVDYAARSVDRITRMVEDLLDAARIREGHLEFKPRPCDLAAIVEQAVEEQRMQAPDRIIRLELPAAQGAPIPIMADALRIGQVVFNFLTNALKYSPEPKPVTVRLKAAGRSVRVFVHDEGDGIALADQARIWDRYQHAIGVTVHSGSGVSLGLGLYISKTIVERHHGRVGVSSTPGQGSTFWFALPLAKPAA
jgi:signal transduction histidine kinase